MAIKQHSEKNYRHRKASHHHLKVTTSYIGMEGEPAKATTKELHW